MLSEMEEIIEYKNGENEPEKRTAIKNTWIKRFFFLLFIIFTPKVNLWIRLRISLFLGSSI